jgi:hypothetical protein
MIVLMIWNEWWKKWSQHNSGTDPASAGVTEANHNTLSQGSRWPSQYSNQASPDYKSEAPPWRPTWVAALRRQAISNILFYRGHPVVFNEFNDKQTGYRLLSNTKIYLVLYSYFNGDTLRFFQPSSGHLTQTQVRYMQCNHVLWDTIILTVTWNMY